MLDVSMNTMSPDALRESRLPGEASLERPQKLADFCRFRWEMRQAKNMTRFLGIGLLLVSLWGINGGPTPWSTILLGFFTLGESFWQSHKPTPDRLLVQGLVFGGFGLLKMLTWQQNGANWDFTTLLSNYIILWVAVRYLSWYPRASRLVQENFTEEQVEDMDDLCDHVLSAKPARTVDVIEFQAGTGFLWAPFKCQLGDGWGLVVRSGTRHIQLFSAAEFGLLWTSKKWLENEYNLRFQIKSQSWTGSISGPSLEKLKLWVEEGGTEVAGLLAKR